MQIHYTGQMKEARKLMLTHYKMNPEEVALMRDDDILEKLDKDFIAVEEQLDNDIGTNTEDIVLIPRAKFVDDDILVLSR